MPQRSSASAAHTRPQILFIDEEDLQLIEQMRTNGGDMLTVAMRQFAAEYPMAANVRSAARAILVRGESVGNAQKFQVLIDERNEWMASYLWLQCDLRQRCVRDTVFVVAGAPPIPSPPNLLFLHAVRATSSRKDAGAAHLPGLIDAAVKVVPHHPPLRPAPCNAHTHYTRDACLLS